MVRPYNRTKEDNRGDRLTPVRASDTSGDTVPLPSKVPVELKNWVLEHAKATGKSQSKIVREALQLYRETVQEKE